MNNWPAILAQVTDPATPAAPGTPAPAGPGSSFALIYAVLFAVFAFVFLSQRSHQKREKREREQLFANMSKNDRVLTIGGIIGTIVQVRDNEVVVKVDETTNTKMTFAKSAITRILADDTSQPEKS